MDERDTHTTSNAQPNVLDESKQLCQWHNTQF